MRKLKTKTTQPEQIHSNGNSIHTYSRLVEILKQKILISRSKAYIGVNSELIAIYWEIGRTILTEQDEYGWGAKIIDRLAADLKQEFPDFKGLSERNLKYMRAFAEAWQEEDVFVQTLSAQIHLTQKGPDQIVQTPFAQLSWSHHITLLDKVKEKSIRLFYIHKAAENGWSLSILKAQLETKLHERQGKAIHNFENTLITTQSDLAADMLKSPYLLDFLSLTEETKERDLEAALIRHLKKFMLELGRGFSFIGNQYKIQVENDEFFLDLLFYNFRLRSFVIFELKVGDFKPEFAGKLNFYVNAVDNQLKGVDDHSTIGVLLCKTPNETLVRYSLLGLDKPLGVAEYRLSKTLPETFKEQFPTVEELDAEFDKEVEKLSKPLDKKLEKLKSYIDRMAPVQEFQPYSDRAVMLVFNKWVLPLREKVHTMLDELSIAAQFYTCEIPILTDGKSNPTSIDAEAYLIGDVRCSLFGIDVILRGFKKAGLDAFDCQTSILMRLYDYKFDIINSNAEIIYAGQYYQEPTENDINKISEKLIGDVVDLITVRLEARNL